MAAAVGEQHRAHGGDDHVTAHTSPAVQHACPPWPSAAARNSCDEADDDTRPINSPPYWSHATPQPRNVSTDSLPAGAITLQDHETSEHDDRNAACWAKSVELVDYTLVNGSTTNIGAFVVWNVRVETLSGSYISVRKRYSEFDQLRRQLVQSFPNFEAAVPSLPPKSIMSRFKPKFLDKRRLGLQYFLNCIMLNPEFSASPILTEFLFA
ncbi:hypothetical protein CDD82_5351 [Ophiocordyceps australis]|uniref:Endosomal/vacuolar adapter protein YPT35 n=1 Tax=Ophiocordyceps australis TaxID=1399860 RepID=A0A2C5ZKV3_9HYPO|nr:hypothetical protein CDD82_5351 [Ophiocordyceps australis]